MVAFLFLGAGLIFSSYQLLLYNNSKSAKAINISEYVFFDGNYYYEGGRPLRDGKVYGLNQEGTEFSYVSFLKTHSIREFLYENPKYVFHKGIWAINQTAYQLILILCPFLDQSNDLSIFPYVFLFFPIIAGGMLTRWSAKIMHILFFVSIIFFTGFFSFIFRYIYPFVPLFFALWLYAFYTVFLYIEEAMVGYGRMIFKCFCVCMVVIFMLVYFIYGYQSFLSQKADKHKDYLAVSSWVREDSSKMFKRIKMMSRQSPFAYLTDSEFIRLPITDSFEKVLKFASLKHVDYIIVPKDDYLGMTGSSECFIDARAACLVLANAKNYYIFKLHH